MDTNYIAIFEKVQRTPPPPDWHQCLNWKVARVGDERKNASPLGGGGAVEVFFFLQNCETTEEKVEEI